MWFEVDKITGKIDLDKPVVYRRDNVNFEDKPASVITEVGLGKFCASACKLAATAELLKDKIYADDIADSIRSIMKDRSDEKRQFLAMRADIIEACKTHGFTIKLVTSSWDTEPSLMEQQRDLIYNPKNKKERFLGQEWNLVIDTLLPKNI